MLIPSSHPSRPIVGWTDLLLVGNEMIDADHRQLFALAGQMREGLLRKQSDDKTRTIIDELMTYTREHFSREEVLMKEIRFVERQEHEFEHRMLTYHLRNLHYRFASGDRDLFEEMEIFLDRWLARHILTADLRLAEAIRTQPDPANAVAE